MSHVPIDATRAQILVDDGRVHQLDVISYDGETLAVVLWYANMQLGLRKPVLVLRLSKVEHLVNDTDPKHPRYLIQRGLWPAELFLGTASPSMLQQYGIESGPDVTFPMAPRPS